jgi:flagellar motor switch protein FliN/FliY
MKTYFDCWISAAKTLFSQALAGEPRLTEMESADANFTGQSFVAEISGVLRGSFAVILDPKILHAPLLGEGIDQLAAWGELLREVAESAAGELLAASGKLCRIDAFRMSESTVAGTRGFLLNAPGMSWTVAVQDNLQGAGEDILPAQDVEKVSEHARSVEINPGVELLLDVELEAALRFGCREMLLGEILKLGPGDVVELDRHITDPVDLVIGDKIVARGEVVLINGNFGLRVSEVAAPQKRLESIRCLF